MQCYLKESGNRNSLHVMRYELSIAGKQQLNRFGIHQISDLLKPEAINALKKKMFDVMKYLIFHDRLIAPMPLTYKIVGNFLAIWIGSIMYGINEYQS